MIDPIKFLDDLKSLDIFSISDEVIQVVQNLMKENVDFRIDFVSKTNKSAKYLCIFILEIMKYREIIN